MLGSTLKKQCFKSKNDSEISVCDVCGQNHDTESCLFISTQSSTVADSVMPSRARLTLPANFTVKDLADGTTTVVTKVRFERGTRFGPFVAPLTSILPPEVNFPLKIFGKTEQDSYYLDTRNENDCNWMCLVASASSSRDTQNLFCYQVHDKIFFSLLRDIEPEEEMRVWYAPFYGIKMGISPESIASHSSSATTEISVVSESLTRAEEPVAWEADTTTGDIPQSMEESPIITHQKTNEPNSKEKQACEDEIQQKREKDEKARTAYVAQQLPPKRLGARFSPPSWRCRECGAKEASVISYARHLMQHLKPPSARARKFPCSLCHKKFVTQKLLDEHEESRHGLSGLHPPILLGDKPAENPTDPDDPLPIEKPLPNIFEKSSGSCIKDGKSSGSDLLQVICVRPTCEIEPSSTDIESDKGNSALNQSINDSSSPGCSSDVQGELNRNVSETDNLTIKSSVPLLENAERSEESSRKLVAVMGENSLQNLLIPIDQQKDIDSLLQSFHQPSREKISPPLTKVPETILNHEFFTRVAGDTVVRDVKSLLSMGYSLQFLVENEDGTSSLVDVLSTGRSVSTDQVTSSSDPSQNGDVLSQQLVIMASGNVPESVPLALQNILPSSVPIVPKVVDPVVSAQNSLLPSISTNSVSPDSPNVNEAQLPSCLSPERPFLNKQNLQSDAKSPLGTLLPSAITNSVCYDSVIPYTDSNSENTSLMEMSLVGENLEREELDYELGALELPLAVDDTNSTDYIMNACSSPPPNSERSNGLNVGPNLDLNTPVKLLDQCINGSLSSEMMNFHFEAGPQEPHASILNSPQLEDKTSVSRDGLTKNFSDLITADAESTNVMLSIQPADSTAEVNRDRNVPSVILNNVIEKSKERNSFEWLENDGLLLPAQSDSVDHLSGSGILNANQQPSVEVSFQATTCSSKNIRLLKDANGEETELLQVTTSEIRAELDGLLLNAHSNSSNNVSSEHKSQSNPQHQLQMSPKSQLQSLSIAHLQSQCQPQPVSLISFHQETLAGSMSQTDHPHWLSENTNISAPAQIQFQPNVQTQTGMLSDPQIQLQIGTHVQIQAQAQQQDQEDQIAPPHQSTVEELQKGETEIEMEHSLISSGPPFICDICNKTFGKVAYLYRHLRKHTGEFTCVACRAVFARKESLQLHECSAQPKNSVGNGASRISCPFCRKQFAAKKQLTRHIANHTGSRRFHCGSCDNNFSSKEAAEHHSKKCVGSVLLSNKQTSEEPSQEINQESSSTVLNTLNTKQHQSIPLRPQRCDLCRRMFSSDITLQRHKMVDHKYPSEQCEHCGRTLALASSTRVAQHFRFCAPAAALQSGNADAAICPECNEPFRQLLLYRQHVFRHTHPYVCVHCQRAFSTLQERGKHKCLALLEQCSQCGHQFGTVSQLERHGLTHGVPSFHCYECGRSFHQVNDFSIHRCFELSVKVSRQALKRGNVTDNALDSTFVSSAVIKRNASENQRAETEVLMCEICGEVCKSRRSLKAHRLLHGERKIECKVCGKRFHRRDVLVEHMYVHEDAQLRCSICNKLLKSKKTLDVHMRHLHSSHSHKRFMCQLCGKEFHQKINLKNHMKSHEPCPEPVNCPDCGRRFPSPEALAKHMPEHTEEPRFHCSQCDRSFVKEQKLQQHMKQHIARGFSCPACGHTLKHRNSLRRHVLKCHPEFSLTRKIAAEDQLELVPNNVGQPQSPEVLLTVSELQLTTHGVQQISVPEDTPENACLLEEGAMECSEDMVLYVLQEPLSCLPLQESSA